MTKEKWRWVPGYEGLYSVSDHGRIMGMPRKNHYGHVLATRVNCHGYEVACLCKNNIKKTFSVHRLVASVFCENPHGKPEINHKDGVKTNNVATNLEWVTKSENERHAYRVLGKQPTRYWAGKPRRFARRFTDEQAAAIRRDTRPSQIVAEEYGVSRTTIKNIRARKIYKDVV